MKIKNKISLSTLKYNANKLRANYQIPYYLVYFIRLIDLDTSLSVINHLKTYTQHYLRVKNYYKMFPSMEKLYNDEILSLFEFKDKQIVYKGK